MPDLSAFSDFMTTSPLAVWIAPLAILGIAFLAGLWTRRYMLPRLQRLAKTTAWEVDDILLDAVRGPIMLWSLLAGAYLALEFSPVSNRAVELAGRALQALWILSATWVGANVVTQLITQYASRWQVAMPMTSLTQNLSRIIIVGLGILVILDGLGVKIGTLLAALGVGSLAVALGLQDTLANMFAGVYIALSKHIRIGDYVKLDTGEEGYVRDITSRATKIVMLSNSMVIVPNAKLAQAIVTNFYLPDRELAVLVQVGVDYSSDLEQVERVTSEVGKEVMMSIPGGVPGFTPFIRYHTFGDFSINFTVILRGREFVDQHLLKHEFIKRLHARYQQEGIVIPFPSRTVYTKAGGRA